MWSCARCRIWTAMDQMMLSKLEAHWKPLTDQTDIQAPEEMTPMLIFCAAIQAMVKADQNLAAQELAWIQERMIETNALQRVAASIPILSPSQWPTAPTVPRKPS
jgi:hypothetical protein